MFSGGKEQGAMRTCRVGGDSVIGNLCACVLSRVQHFWDPMDCRPLGSFAHGILQARILEWVAMPFSKESSQPKDQMHISYVSSTGRWVLYY